MARSTAFAQPFDRYCPLLSRRTERSTLSPVRLDGARSWRFPLSFTDPVEPGVTEIRRTYDPVTATTIEVRRETRSSAGWWVAGLVVVVAIIATAVVLASRGTSPDNSAIAAATAQGSAQTAAQDAQNAAALAQSNAQASLQSTQAAAASAAADASASRARADAAASRADDASGQFQGTIPPRTLPSADNAPAPPQ